MAKYSVKFTLKAKRGNTALQHIIIRLRVNNEKAEWNTCERSTVEDWDKMKERSLTDELINNRLAQLDQQVRKIINQFEMEGRTYTARMVKDTFTGKYSKSVNLLDFYDFYLNRLKEHGGYAPSTLTRYVGTRNLVSRFIRWKFKSYDVNISLIDYSFIEDFDNYMRRIIKGIKKDTPAHNTISKNHSRFRTFILNAVKHRHIDFNPYTGFKITYEEDTRDFLSQLEIQRLTQVALPNQSLRAIRDIFVFSCFTGLRFSDVESLAPSNLKVYRGRWSLEIVQQKTQKRLELPLFDTAKEIIEKYQKWQFETGKLLPVVSNQKTNAYLKVLADLAGIDKNLTFHMARHTFATTVLMDNGVPLEEIQALLGHSNIKETQKYARLTNKRLFTSEPLAEVNRYYQGVFDEDEKKGQYKAPITKVMW